MKQRKKNKKEIIEYEKKTKEKFINDYFKMVANI